MRTASDPEDVFGRMVMAHWRGELVVEVIEREDGYISATQGPAIYFSPPEDWLPVDVEAIAHARGRVLDVGCGVGRQALVLQERGHPVVATDVSPLAIAVCRERGVKDARAISITRLDASLGQFDTIGLFGNNFGLLGDEKRARWLLRRFRRLTAPAGRIVATSHNIYGTSDPIHLAYHAHNWARGRMGGQIRMRVRFRQFKGPWFDYLMVSPDEMRALVDGTGWHLSAFHGDVDGRYVAVLERG
jgi:SAM-dependent methyltransferase